MGSRVRNHSVLHCSWELWEHFGLTRVWREAPQMWRHNLVVMPLRVTAIRDVRAECVLHGVRVVSSTPVDFAIFHEHLVYPPFVRNRSSTRLYFHVHHCDSATSVRCAIPKGLP